MAIFDFSWLSESIRKRALRYLLQRYLGNFLLEKLTLDQLSVDLYEGKGGIRDIRLDVDTINDEFNHLSSFMFIDGQIDELSVYIPWSSLLTDSSSIHLNGISLNLCKLGNKKSNDFRESTYISRSLMTSSMQIAEEIVNEEQEKFDGLEMFAQLIDSVLRRFKLSATNTTFKFVFPRKTGDGQEIEVRIKYLKCEEEEHIGDDEKSDENINIVSESITKIISLEGIEVLINSVLVCKVNGKHSFKLKIDEKDTDLEIVFGSHVFAIINSKHLETLIEMFECGEQMPMELTAMPGQKLMSSEDYLRVEQQLQVESGCGKTTTNTVISSSSVTMDSKNWTTCGLIDVEDEPNFLPLKKMSEDKDTKSGKKDRTKKSQFNCQLKIPGLTVCLIAGDQMPRFEGIPIMETQNSFPKINAFLDKIFDGFNHLRFLSVRLSLDINSESLSFSCGDLMVSEVLNNKLSPILWNRIDNPGIVSPFLRFKARDNLLSLTMDSINLRLDPTFLERIQNYYNFFSHKSNSQTNFDFNLNINCNDIKVELLFPIPDLRAFDERSHSELRDESILLKLSNAIINVNSSGGEIQCNRFAVDLKVSEKFTNIINGHSVDPQIVCLKFRIGMTPSLSHTLTEEEVNQLFDADMEDSIYVGQSTPHQVTEPFQVKRKVIGRDANENEQVLTPGDRVHQKKYIEAVTAATEFYFELFVPTVDIHFPNKDLFELLYNRIANDLILWIPYTDGSVESNLSRDQPIGQNPTFFSLKTMTDSSSTNSSFHSFMGSPQTNKTNQMCFVFNINDITFEMGSNEDESQELFAQNLMMGIVVADSSESTTTLCLSCENLSLKSDGSVIISGNIYSEPNCAFGLAVDIKRENESLKKIKIALQLSCAAMYEIQINVFERFWDFINVTDELVIGYVPPKVVTELHIDVLDSAITLENLTTRPALITFEDIYLTSMVVENTNQTLLRIFAEETLFCFKRNKTALEAMKSYICVIQTGIIDLNLKLSKDGKLEFKVSNNAIDVRVCSDSFSALCQLITGLTTSSSNNMDIETNFSDNIPPEKTFDGKLMEDAMGDNDEEMSFDEESDEEMPKFCTNCESPQLDESGFWILGDDDLGTGIKKTSEPQIRVLTDEPIHLIENHFNISRQRLIPEISPSTICRYFLEEMTLILHLFDGKDFDDDLQNDSPIDRRTEDSKSHKSGKSNAKSYYSNEPRVRFSDNSVHIWENIDLLSGPTSMRGCNSGQNIGPTNSFKCMGGVKRQNDKCVSISLYKVKTLFENFEPEFPLSWRFLFMVQDFEIIDRVMESKIKKMLYEYCSEVMPRRKHKNMFSIRATAFRNNDNKEECELKIAVKPLRINIDQDTLLFLEQFFTTVIANLTSEETETAFNTMVANNPIVNNLPNYDEVMQFDDTASNASQTTTTTTCSNNTLRSASDNPNKVFFRLFTFSPDVPIRLDYHGKHVDFDRGALKGLFLGLGQLNQSELRLKRLHNKHGLLGIDKVLSYALNEWAKDIKRNQLPSLLGGVGPMHSFIQLFQGIRDLVWMPIDQYRRDRRLVRGLQRGAHSFSASTAMATLDLANRFVSLIQSAAQFAHDVVTPPTPGHRQQTMALMNAQPRDLREGVAVAYALMREGLHDTVREVATAGMVAEDMSGAIGGIVRHMPGMVFRPVIDISNATANVIVGLRNQLTPEARNDDHQKYKNASER